MAETLDLSVSYARWSTLFCPTLKETPRDAEVVSHQLLVRAGFIQRVASGIYTLLPLGLRVIRKFENIVRSHMNAVGAQEVLMPAVIPSDLWVETGRWDKYGPELLRLTDRHGNSFCFGPTHEEVITHLIRSHIRSYKELPVTLYQIQTKFRDEIRPRFGLMRGREFGMKDAYSFHTSADELNQTYENMRSAYTQIFKAAGLESRSVSADSGTIGGAVSAEFMVVAETGEDGIMTCDDCGYAANVEVAASAESQDGQDCPVCKKGRISLVRGIEVGHIFQLGTLYSEAMKALFLDDQGKSHPIEMGCYGIGIGRTVAAAIEQNHDEDGIIWPPALAPYLVDVIIVSTKEAELVKIGESVAQTIQKSGLDCILDDRASSPGVKFKDATLVGFPFQVVVGKKGLENGMVELVNRKSGEKQWVAPENVVDEINRQIVNGA